jgi:DNA-binding MarR family transcriptional regulator
MPRMNNTTSSTILRLLRAQAFLESRFGAALGAVHGLSVNEMQLLLHLDSAAGGRLRRVDLAERLHLSQSSITRMVAPMEKIGLVTREADARDARVGYVVLSPAGRRRVREAMKTFAQLSDEVFADRWSTQDVRTLGSLLGRLTAALPGQVAIG